MSVLCKSPSVIKGLVEGIVCPCLCCYWGWAGLDSGIPPCMARVRIGSPMVPAPATLGHPVLCGLGVGHPAVEAWKQGRPRRAWGGVPRVGGSLSPTAWVPGTAPSPLSWLGAARHPAGLRHVLHWGSALSPTTAPLFCSGGLVPWVICGPLPQALAPSPHPASWQGRRAAAGGGTGTAGGGGRRRDVPHLRQHCGTGSRAVQRPVEAEEAAIALGVQHLVQHLAHLSYRVPVQGRLVVQLAQDVLLHVLHRSCLLQVV